MPSAANRMRGSARRARRSSAKWPRRSSTAMSSSALTQPAVESAMAMPSCANGVKSQRHRERDIHRHGEGGDPHRRLRVVAREEARRHHLDQDEGREPRGVGGEAPARSQPCRPRSNAPRWNSTARMGCAATREPDGGRHRQAAAPARARGSGSTMAPPCRRPAHVARQRRQDRRADGDADHARAAAGSSRSA